MPEEPKTALAALFQMRGRDTITESDFVLDASMKLRWFSPKEAQRLLQIGLEQGLLRADGGRVQAAFDVAAVAVPTNYRPGPEAVAPPPRKPRDLFATILERLRSTTGEGTLPLVARINEVQERLGIDADVAAALVATREGADVSDLLEELQDEIVRRGR